MPLSDCTKAKIAAIQKRVLQYALKVLCNQLKAVLNAVNGMIQTELAILQPIFALERLFITDFVIFPLQTAESAVGKVTGTFQKPLFDVGIDRSCSDTSKMHKAIETVTGKMKSVQRFLYNKKASAQLLLDDIAAQEEALQKFSEAVSQFLSIDCG